MCAAELGEAMAQVTDAFHPSVRRFVSRALSHAGRVDLTENAFGQLCALIGAMLQACEATGDFTAAGAVAHAADNVRCASLPLTTAIRAHPIWSDPRLWAAALDNELAETEQYSAAVDAVQRMMELLGAPEDVRTRFVGRASQGAGVRPQPSTPAQTAAAGAMAEVRQSSKIALAWRDPLEVKDVVQAEQIRTQKEDWLRQKRGVRGGLMSCISSFCVVLF